VFAPSRGGPDEGEVVAEVGRSAGHGPASQEFVQDRGGDRSPRRRGDGVPRCVATVLAGGSRRPGGSELGGQVLDAVDEG